MRHIINYSHFKKKWEIKDTWCKVRKTKTEKQKYQHYARQPAMNKLRCVAFKRLQIPFSFVLLHIHWLNQFYGEFYMFHARSSSSLYQHIGPFWLWKKWQPAIQNSTGMGGGFFYLQPLYVTHAMTFRTRFTVQCSTASYALFCIFGIVYQWYTLFGTAPTMKYTNWNSSKCIYWLCLNHNIFN